MAQGLLSGSYVCDGTKDRIKNVIQNEGKPKLSWPVERYNVALSWGRPEGKG